MALATTALLAMAGLAGCGGSKSAPSLDSVGGQAGSEWDSLISNAPVAPAGTIAGNKWATKIKEQGYLKLGGVDSIPLFSLKDLKSGELIGFDAGLSQMLAHYITGKDDVHLLTKLTFVTVDTRESLLENNSVDVVFATYSITPARAQKVNFAGPYYMSGDAIMVKKGDSTIKSVDDLAGKTVATQANSTAALALKEKAPKAKVLLFKEDAQCVAAVQSGRADAYVLDQGILPGDAHANPAVQVVGGDPFTVDPYGIGLNKDNDAKEFVNGFLQAIEDSGDWAKLYTATIGTVITGEPPKPPALGSVDGS